MPLTNAVYTGVIKGTVNLYNSRWLSLPQYTPPLNRFPGATVRLQSTYLVFTSGKVVINKCKAPPMIQECEALLGVAIENVKLSHMSGSMKVRDVKLNLLLDLVDGGEYEPEIHPGLLYKIDKVSVIVYHTGTIMYCGMRSFEQLMDVENEISMLIDSYRKFYE